MTGRQSRTVNACRSLKQHLFRYQGQVSAALVLGGVDHTGPSLYSVAPHGSTDKVPYVTMGSGSLAAMGVFEAGFRPEMELEEAKKLVRDAIAAGVFNDLGSGSNIDLTIITKDKATELRGYEIANVRGPRFNDYKYKPGTTAVLSEKVQMIVTEETITPTTGDAAATAAMDTS